MGIHLMLLSRSFNHIAIKVYCKHIDSSKRITLYSTTIYFNLFKVVDTFHLKLYNIVMDDGHRSKLNYEFNRHGKTTQRNRLVTFETWTLGYPDPFLLSKLGFWFTGKSDQVQCCECSKKIDDWKNKSNPLIEHYKVNNGCVFVQNNRDILFSFRLKTTYIPNCITNIYVTVENRMLSFKVEGVNLPGFLTVDSLAHAGFYYIGPGDKVKCFSCEIILVDWEIMDIPIGEHYRWSPDCDYIQHCLPILNDDVESSLKAKQKLTSFSPEYPTYNNRESFSLQETGSFDEKVELKSKSSLEILKNLNDKPNRMVRESFIGCSSNQLNTTTVYPNIVVEEHSKGCTSQLESLKFPIQEGSESCTSECEVYDECRNDEDELNKILNSEKVEAAKEIFEFPSYVIEDFVRRYYKQHHRDFDSAEELCTTLLEEQEHDSDGKQEMCDSSTLIDKASKNMPKISNRPITFNTQESNEHVHKTVEKTQKEDYSIVSGFDSKLSINSETHAICKICMDTEVQVTFIPCRHLVTCEECSNLVTECPICRTHIRERMKIYLS